MKTEQMSLEDVQEEVDTFMFEVIFQFSFSLSQIFFIDLSAGT